MAGSWSTAISRATTSGASSGRWRSLTVVCERIFNRYFLADACEVEGITFVPAHALYLKAIHGGKNKNDRIDSEKLARLLRANLIPPSYVYPGEMRPVRALLRRRMTYVWRRAALLTRVEMNQLAEGMEPVRQSRPNRDRWEERLMESCKNPLRQFGVRIDMKMIRLYDQMIEKLEAELLRITKRDACKEFNILQTIHGVGNILSLTIMESAVPPLFYSFGLNDIRSCVQPAKNRMPPRFSARDREGQADFLREWDCAGQSTGFSGSPQCNDTGATGRAGSLDWPHPPRIRIPHRESRAAAEKKRSRTIEDGRGREIFLWRLFCLYSVGLHGCWASSIFRVRGQRAVA